MLHKPWEVVGAEIFTIKSNALLYIVDYYSKLPVIKKPNGLSADNLIRAVKIVIAEFGLPKETVSDVGTNFISDNGMTILQAAEYRVDHYLIIPSTEQ